MSSAVAVDEDLYSRQLYVLGVEAMKKISSSSVLISGMGGLGVEIAKNIILAGIKNVTIHDTRNCTVDDLAGQFYLNENNIGQNRAKACYGQLIGLNAYVSVSVSTDELTDQFVKKYNCVVLTDYRKFSELEHFSALCHQNNIKLILTDTRGVFGYIFTDFGESFTSFDTTGERPSRFLISMITNNENGIVTCDENEPHNLSDGDRVRFEEVEGMVELNNKEFEVKVINPRQFSIGDTSKFGQYTSVHRSGYGNQVVVPKTFHYKSLTEALKVAGEKTVMFDLGCFGRDQQVVLLFMAMSKVLENGSLEMTEEELKASAQSLNKEFSIVDEVDESLLHNFFNGLKSVISPTCAVFGGIAGQEVLKAVSAKFTPLDQFLGIGYVEALPSKLEFVPKGDRYDAYRRIFGNAQQEVMQKLRYFMLGAGALGCEMLKNWALMGVATLGDGLVTLTDMDSIERSNLNRQFLFRDKDIGKMKSSAAAEAAQVMNPSMKLDAHTNRVGPESAAIYNDVFFNNLSGVCNALDNVITRRYSDQQCVFYKKPMLESGTLGTKAHYQMIVPYLTESYSSMADPPEKEIPQCTLHNFPSNIDHCCMWARDVFTGIFEQMPDSINKFIKDPNFISSMRKNSPGDVLPTLRTIKEFMITHKPQTYEDCARWARGKFEELYEDKINELLTQFPRDHITDTGVPFWTGNKRAPTPIEFSTDNEEIRHFIKSGADIMARIFSIKVDGDAVELAAKGPIKAEAAPKVVSDDLASADEAEIESLLKEIEVVKSMSPIKGEEFEKDDDSNGHMDFVAAAANLRAINYEIKTESKLEIKRIAGKIIPAIATTTAMICGFVALEMYKIHSIEPKKLEDFRSGYINLAIDMFGISEPGRCRDFECTANKQKYNLWTTWDIEGDVTCGEFIEQAKAKYGVTVDMLTIGSSIIYMSVMQGEKKQTRLNTKITDVLVNELKQPPLTKDQMYINITALCIDDDYNDVETPGFRLKVK
jgi:ubiquitin-activating enzyme E1